MFNFNEIKKSHSLALVVSGLIFALNLHMENIIPQIAALFALGVYFFVISKYDNYINIFLMSYLFFASYLLVSTFYFFSSFPLWLALVIFFASPALYVFSTVLLIIPAIRRSIYKMPILAISFGLFSYMLLSVYPFETWTIPHIAYSQSANYLLLGLLPYIGFFGFFAVLVAIGYLNYLVIKSTIHKPRILALYGSVFCAIFLFTHYDTKRQGMSEERDFTFIGVQHWFYANTSAYKQKQSFKKKENIDTLLRIAKEKYGELLANGAISADKPVIVAFGEIDITKEQMEYVKEQTSDEPYYMSFSYEGHQESEDKEYPYNQMALLHQGQLLYAGYKEQRAPHEKIAEKKNDLSVYHKINGKKFFSSICYDLTFLSTNAYLKGKDIIIGHINDFNYGVVFAQIHKRNIIFRAVENEVDIFAVGTTGPTFYANKDGVITGEMLPFYKNLIAVY